MKNKTLIKCTVSAVVLTVILSFGGCGGKTTDFDEGESTTERVQQTFTDTPNYVKKSETVYVTMDLDGTVHNTVVTDRIHTDRANVRVEDKTDLLGVEHVNGNILPVYENGHLVWNMNTTDLYYTGKSDKKLPVDMKFEFSVNGKVCSATEAKGRNGHVIIKVTATNTDSYVAEVNGASVTMYNPMVVIGGTLLNGEKFSNITVRNGKTIGDGNKEIAFGITTPGLCESLGLDENSMELPGDFTLTDTFTIEADTTDFSVGSIYFAVLPLSSSDIGAKLPQTISDIRESLTQVENLQDTLQKADPDDLIGTLLSNPEKLSELTKNIKMSVGLFNDNKELLSVVAKYMTKKNIESFKKIAEDVKDINFEEYLDLLLDEQFQSMLSEFKSVADDIKELMPVIEAMSKDLNDPEVKKALENLPQTLETMSALGEFFGENEQFFNSLSTLLSGEAMSGLTDAAGSLSDFLSDEKLGQYIGLTENADTLVARIRKWFEIGSEYRIFTNAAQNTETSVMFIYEASWKG